MKPADVGGQLWVRAVGRRTGYEPATTTTVGGVRIASGTFAVTGVPTVSGVPQAGQTLVVAEPSAVVPHPASVTTVWTIDGISHPSDAPALALTGEHVGRTVSCVQVYGAPGYLDATRDCAFPDGSAEVVVAGPGAPDTGDAASWTVLVPAEVKGRARVGAKLRALRPVLSAPAATWHYQWLRNGKPVKGAVRSSYRIRKADRGRRLTVRVTASAPGRADLVSVSPVRRVRR